jgi:hypothetical protein
MNSGAVMNGLPKRWGKLVPGAQVEPITIGLIDAERVVPQSAKPAATRTMSCD